MILQLAVSPVSPTNLARAGQRRGRWQGRKPKIAAGAAEMPGGFAGSRTCRRPVWEGLVAGSAARAVEACRKRLEERCFVRGCSLRGQRQQTSPMALVWPDTRRRAGCHMASWCAKTAASRPLFDALHVQSAAQRECGSSSMRKGPRLVSPERRGVSCHHTPRFHEQLQRPWRAAHLPLEDVKRGTVARHQLRRNLRISESSSLHPPRRLEPQTKPSSRTYDHRLILCYLLSR